MASVVLQGIRKRYGAQEILKGIDLTCEDGEFLVLVGPSGCGKSTLLNLIAGLDIPSEGEIHIGKRRVNDLHPKDRDIAMVFQSYALYPTMSVRENIGFGMEMRKVPKVERERKTGEVAKMLQLEELLDRKPSQLSGGQRQRVAMGRALVRDPAVFLFDEPLSNLDAKLRVEMRNEIKRLHQKLKTTAVYVTHDQIEAMTLASRIAVMKDGVVQQLADPDTIYNHPANLFVASFIGTPSMNFIPARIEKSSEGLNAVLDGFNLPFDALGPLAAYVGREVILGIRPEHLTADTSPGRTQKFEATVEMVEPTGADTWVIFRWAGREITARVQPGIRLQPGGVFQGQVQLPKVRIFDLHTQEKIL